ncbi:MAG TPA: prolyl oligopeptidase family serine peptidase [Solirubrobacterales bacterium]
MATVAPYGSWESPLSAAAVASGGGRKSGARLATDGALWWAELRPDEGGRTTLMRRPEGGMAEEATPAGANARTRAHEYGGGAWTLAAPDTVLYCEFADQRLYRLRLDGEPVAITPEPEAPGALRYADMQVAPDGETVVAVREVHPAGGGEAENQIVALRLSGEGEPSVLASGRDFYSFPRLAADGATLAFTCWDHPNMPWDGTELWTTPLGDPGAARKLAGGRRESIFQPEWGPDGRLHFVSDRDGWWNLYAVEATSGEEEQLSAEDADLAHPQWLFGGATYAFADGGEIVCVRTERATEQLFARSPGGGPLRNLGLPYTNFGFPSIAARGSRVAFVAGTPEAEPRVVVYDLANGEREEVQAEDEDPVDPAYVPAPRAVEFATGDGEVAHGFYYPPTNPEFEAPAGEAPPLIVESHGGPTSHVVPALDREFLYWTSRGFGIVDVNYRGSTGFGRAYREKLNGTWGVVDNEDCVRAALHLAAAGDADGGRLTIRGGSAGGYATLCALVFHDDFAAGASYFGVADAEALATDTHKFESRYLDNLIGPYPERADLYRERSPIHFVERLRSPAILFQGLEDEIVPPNQAETMVAAMKVNGIPHAYLAFEGEQHGFRRAETNIRCMEAELYFYGRILGFEPAGEIDPVEIDCLD